MAGHRNRVSACGTSVAVALVTLVLVSAGCRTAQPFIAGDGVQQFRQRVDAYMDLRRDVQRTLPPVQAATDAEHVRQSVEALAAAVRQARRRARVGDIFTAAARREFRAVIENTLCEHDYPVAELLAEQQADFPRGARRPDIRINHSFPWEFGSGTPPCLLATLPALPKALEYMFVGRDLLLLDIDANLVLDILPGALPRSAKP
jgi:hypothetical protein